MLHIISIKHEIDVIYCTEDFWLFHYNIPVYLHAIESIRLNKYSVSQSVDNQQVYNSEISLTIEYCACNII